MGDQKSDCNKVLAAGFLLLMFLPLGTQLYSGNGGDRHEMLELRALTAAPQLPATVNDWLEYPVKFQTYYQDNFGLRKLLLPVAYNIKVALGIDPKNFVLVGKSGWQFLSARSMVEHFRGAMPLDSLELQKLSADFDQLSKQFEAIGINFVHFVAPEKQSIYPEYLPARIKQVGPSRLDQFRSISTDSNSFIDVKPVLLKAKDANVDLYYKKNFHWNCWAAFLAYREVIEKGINTPSVNVPIVEEVDFDFRDLSPENSKGDLVGQNWIRGLYSKDTSFECLLKNDPLVEMHFKNGEQIPPDINNGDIRPENAWFEARGSYRNFYATNRNPNAKLKAIIIRDSFFPHAAPSFKL